MIRRLTLVLGRSSRSSIYRYNSDSMKRLLLLLITVTLSVQMYAQVDGDNLVRITTSYTSVEQAVDAIVPILGEIGIVPSYVDAAHGIINLAPTYGCDSGYIEVYMQVFRSEGKVKVNFSGLFTIIGPSDGSMPLYYTSAKALARHTSFLRMANIAFAIPHTNVEYLNYKSLTSLAKRVNEQSNGL